MVDIHSHIVWGVDDGPKGLDDSLAMLEAVVAGGTAEIVATPHANPRYEFLPDVNLERIEELRRHFEGRLRIHTGCEFHLTFDNVDALLDEPRRYSINGTQYLLVECPDFHIGRHTDTVLQRLIDAGLVPIIAHPERNPVLRKDLAKLDAWVEFGCLLQVTALSITGGFGASAKTTSMKLLDRGLAHVIASDSHDALRRPPSMREAYHAVESRFGNDTAEFLFRDTPKSVVEGERLSGGKQIHWEEAAPWYKFW